MFINQERDKLENAAIFFVKKTKHCYTLKLLKLLNFLDVEHFRQSGKLVTGLEYVAWEQGPVALTVWHELKSGSLGGSLKSIAEVDPITKKTLRRKFLVQKQFNSKIFTKRELAIMERLADYFATTSADDMSEYSHMRGLPWRKVYQGGKGNGSVIPPELAFDAEPIIADKPTIERDEFEYLKAVAG